MPDLGPFIGALLDLVSSTALKGALGALVRTVAGMVLWVVVCTAGSVWLAATGSTVRPVIALVLCLAAAVPVTAVLAVKNAVLRGLLAGVEKAALGSKAVRLVFSQLGVRDEAAGGAVVRLAERVPLRDAEAKLTSVIEGLLKSRAEQSGVRAWVARGLMSAVVTRVQSLTLARFRSDDLAHGGVDLVRVRDELAGAVDGLIAKQVKQQALRLTVLVAFAYAAVVLVMGYVVGRVGL